jgi:hypothetical protein
MSGAWNAVWITGLATLVLLAGIGFYSPEARMRRRRRKNHGRLISKGNRASVRLSVKPPKK